MQTAAHQVIAEWIAEASCPTAANRRQNPRYPFFRQVSITVGGDQGTKLPAVSRNISPRGIGLLHRLPLENDQLTLNIPPYDQVDISIQITWCDPCGEGWYLSGGRFVGKSAVQVTSLLLAGVLADFDRRGEPRYPFFRPVSVSIDEAQGKKLTAFSRDISATGIGLLHNMPLASRRHYLAIPRLANEPFKIDTTILWCSGCGEEWYVSGGRFGV